MPSRRRQIRAALGAVAVIGVVAACAAPPPPLPSLEETAARMNAELRTNACKYHDWLRPGQMLFEATKIHLSFKVPDPDNQRLQDETVLGCSADRNMSYACGRTVHRNSVGYVDSSLPFYAELDIVKWEIRRVTVGAAAVADCTKARKIAVR